MKLASLVMLTLAFLLVLAWSPGSAQRAAAATEVCTRVTAERVLASPGIAAGWARAMRSRDPSEIARMHELVGEIRTALGEIRTAHGCIAEDDPAGGVDALPPGHPPVGDALPPGHPPIGAGGLPPGHPGVPAPPSLPLFEAPAVLSI